MSIVENIFTHFNSKNELAEKLGCSPENLNHWRTRGIPGSHAIAIEKLSGGKFKAIEVVGKK